MKLAERDAARKSLVQYYAKLRSVGATERRARELTAQKARTMGAQTMVNAVVVQVEGEIEEVG